MVSCIFSSPIFLVLMTCFQTLFLTHLFLCSLHTTKRVHLNHEDDNHGHNINQIHNFVGLTLFCEIFSTSILNVKNILQNIVNST